MTPPCACGATPCACPRIDLRVAALQRFAIAITALNILGRLFFGFEQSWAQMAAAVAGAYLVELFLEGIDARSTGRKPAFSGGPVAMTHFLLPAHISAMAVSMLLYPGDRLLPMAFATAVAIASKWLLRAPTPRGPRHFLNPSNTGIAATLLLFPSVGIAPPYHFTEHLGTVGDWLLPAVILVSGTFLNTRFTQRVPLLVGWLGGFAVQAILRSLLDATPLVASLVPMTGMAFMLFTFYMITDPATTPAAPRQQFLFGAGVALLYGLLMLSHVVFTLFFALFAACLLRGISMHLLARRRAAGPRDIAFAPGRLPAEPMAAERR